MNHYSEKIIQDIVKAYYGGRSVQRLVEEYQIPRSTIYAWLSKVSKQDNKEMEMPIARVDYNNLLRRVAKLESRLRELQEVDCSVHSQLQVKLKELARLCIRGFRPFQSREVSIWGIIKKPLSQVRVLSVN